MRYFPINRLFRIFGSTLCIVGLTACVAKDPTSSSSSNSTNSSIPTQSSSNSSVTSSVASALRVQAQDYDRFLESDARQGAQDGRCSQGDVDLVDVTDNSGVCAIGWTTIDEWVEYDLSGLATGTYDLIARVSSAQDGKRVRFSLGGSDIGIVTSPNQGWDSYSDVTLTTISITASATVVRAEFLDGDINFNYFELTPLQVDISSSSSSSIASSSSQSGYRFEDAVLDAATRTQYDQDCAICHMHKGNGVFSAQTSPDFNINDVLINRGGFSDLVEYVHTDMPFSGGDQCTIQTNCAINTSAWMVQIAQSSNNPQGCDDKQLTYGLRTVKLLSALELKNSLVDLGLIDEGDFQSKYEYASNLSGKSSYTVNTRTAVDENRMDKIRVAAEELSVIAAQKTKQQSSCGSSCKQAFLNTAEKLYRRPLSSAEKQNYDEIFNNFSGDDALEIAYFAALSSPSFLYKSEVGMLATEAKAQGLNIGQFSDDSNKLDAVDNNAYVLDNYELATALAYMYTGSTPDDDLLSAARENRLNTEQQILEQVDRLMNTPRGKEHTANFGATWFLGDRVRGAVRADPKLTSDIKNDMAQEVRELFSYIMYDDAVPFRNIYAGDTTVVNRRLANYYGINSASNGDDNWVPTDSNDRGGIITSGAFMVNTSTDAFTRPIIRAVKLRELMLCHIVPPPNNIALDPEEQEELQRERDQAVAAIQADYQAGILTSREYFERQTDSPSCEGCHKYMINPLFGLEDFDAYGLPRTTQNGIRPDGVGTPNLPVDNSGTLWGFEFPGDQSESFDFNGSKDLGEKMADLPAVRACLASNTFRWLTDLPIEKDEYSKQANGDIDEPVLLTEEQIQGYSCLKEQLISELGSADNPRNMYRKVGALDLLRLRRSIEPTQLRN